MYGDWQRGSTELTVYPPSFCSLSRRVWTMMVHMHASARDVDGSSTVLTLHSWTGPCSLG